MNKRKKYLGGFYTLFVMLLLLLLSTSTTCYARTTLTEEEAEYIYKYIFSTEYTTQERIELNNGTGAVYTIWKSDVYQDGVQGFLTWFNENNTLDINPDTTIFWYRQYAGNSGSFYYANFNNSKPYGNDYPFLYLHFNPGFTTGTHQLEFLAVDDDKNIVSNYGIKAFTCNFSSLTISFSNMTDATLGNSLTSYGYRWATVQSTWNDENINNGNSILNNIPGIISFSSTNAIYTNYNVTIQT